MSNYVLRPGLKEEEEKKKVLAREAANLPDVKESNQIVDGFGKINDHRKVAVGVTNEAVKRGDISTIQGKQIKENINNPEKMQRSIENTIGNNKPSLTDSFMESLAFFMPQALGAGIGALFEGSAGALEGASIAGSLAKEARDYDLQRERLKQTRSNRRKRDITPDFVDKKTGTPLFTEEQPDGTVKFVDDTGKIYPSSGVKSMREIQEEQSHLNKLERQAKNLDMRERMEVLDSVTEFRKSNDKDLEKIKSMDNVVGLINSNNPITSDQIATFNARGLFDEVGRLSDDDVKRAVPGAKLGIRVKNNISQFIKGDAAPEMKKIAAKLIQFVADRKRSQIEKALNMRTSKNKANLLGVDQKLLKELYREELGIDLKVNKYRSVINKKSMTDAQRKRMQELREKYRK